MSAIGRIKEIWRYPVKGMGGESVKACLLSKNGLAGDRQWAVRDELRDEVQSCKTRPALLQCQARYRRSPESSAISPVEVTFPDGAMIASDDPEINARLSVLNGRASTLESLRPASDVAFYRRYKADDHTWREELAATFERAAGEPLPDLDQLPAVLVDHVAVPGTFFLVTPLHVITTATLDALKQLQPEADWDLRRFRPNVVIETDPSFSGPVEQQWVEQRLQMGNATVACVSATPRCGAITRAQRGLAFDSSMLRTVVRQAAQNAGVYAVVEYGAELKVGDAVSLVDA
jgi:uncharacterized protein